MKFECTKGYGICFYNKYDYLGKLFGLGGGSDIGIYRENAKEKSYCHQYEIYFNYHEYKNALCGAYNFTPKRFIVIQMKQKKQKFQMFFFEIY